MSRYLTVKQLSLLLFILLISPVRGNPVYKHLDKNGINKILSQKDQYDLTGFRTFLRGVSRSYPGIFFRDKTINTGKLTGGNRAETLNLYRLLGIYARLKYSDEITGLLSRMVSLRTYRKPGHPREGDPAVIELGKLVEATALKLGLLFRNRGNRVFEVILRGEGEGSLGVHAHCDTVPADKKNWVLEDGTRLDPFRLTITGGRIYGRGVLDNKGSIARVLYSMKAVRESGLRLKRDIRLIIETSEETGSKGLNYYRKRFRLPEYNIVLDNYYPVTLTEKGYGELTVSFRERRGGGDGPEIVDVTGASASNMIPGRSTAVIKTADPGKLERILSAQSRGFASAGRGGLTFRFRKGKGKLLVTARGVSAHSSEPRYGANPLQELFCFLHEVSKEAGFRKNRFRSAAAYVHNILGRGYSGEKPGIGYNSGKTGPLTITLTRVMKRGQSLDLVINLRVPFGMNRDDLRRRIINAHRRFSRQGGMRIGCRLFLGKPFRSRAPAGLISILTDTFNAVTGLQAKPTGSGGGSAARFLPKAISFGPCYPGERCMMHVENEFRERGRFLTDIQLVTEMILRAGNY